MTGLADSEPLTLQGSDYAKAVEPLNAAIDSAEGLVIRCPTSWNQ
jgi:hypothetical protein